MKCLIFLLFALVTTQNVVRSHSPRKENVENVITDHGEPSVLTLGSQVPSTDSSICGVQGKAKKRHLLIGET